MKNSVVQVKKLQTFLDSHGGATLPVTGFFGPETTTAVSSFQKTHANEVLAPWGESEPSGFVYYTTRKVINETNCGTGAAASRFPQLSSPISRSHAPITI